MRSILDIKTAKVAVELTSRCNLHCGMCPMSTLERTKADMPWPLVEKVAADFADNGIRVRWLHEMGEPLLYPRVAEAIELFSGCSLSTNAVLLDEACAVQLLATSLERIRLCLDTVNPSLYAEIRKGSRFDKVTRNIRRFLELSRGHQIRVEIQRMISLQTANESIRDLEDLFELTRFPQARVIEKTCEGLDTADETELHEAFYGCFQGYPFKWFIVLSDGRVTHCCYDYEGSQSIGDMRTQSVREIVESETIPRLMNAFKSKDWSTLPRCGECHKNRSGKAVLVDQMLQLGHKVNRVLPVTAVARKLINR
jgi:MoaA/NifB/PqqE/SkfB family radical SAM enzyme